MKTVRLLTALLLTGVLPTLAQAQSYTSPYAYSTAPISRAEFVQLAMQQTGTLYSDGINCFNDVRNQPFAPYVCAAKQQGIITGYPNGSYRPNNPITFVEAAAIIVRAERVYVGAGTTWYAPYLQQMSEWNAIPSSVTNILDTVSHAQASEMISAAMNRSDDGDDDYDDDNDDDDGDSDDELRLSVDVTKTRVEPEDRVTYRIRLENLDNDDIDDIEVTAELDNDMQFISASDDGDYDDDEVEWDDIEVEEDETKTLLLTIEVDDDADDGDALRLEVRAEGLTVRKTITVDDDADEEAALDISITDSSDPVEEDDLLTYTIRLENEEDDDIRVDVVAELDDDVDFVSASDDGDEERGEVEWEDIRIDENEVKILTVTVRVDDARDGQRLLFKVEANEETETEETRVDDDDDDDDDNDSDEDIDITISDSKDPVREGDTVTYYITLENNENDDIEVDVRAELDDGMTFLSATYSGDEDDDVVEWEDFELDEDETRTVAVTVRINNDVDDGDTLRLRVEAGDGSDTETTRVDD